MILIIKHICDRINLTFFEFHSLLFSTNHQLVMQANGNLIQVWDSEGVFGEPPKIHKIVFTL